MTMKRGETVYQFRNRVTELVESCYANFASINKRQLVEDFIVHHSLQDLKTAVLSTQCSKLDEAVNSALMADSMRFFIRPLSIKFSNEPYVLPSRNYLFLWQEVRSQEACLS